MTRTDEIERLEAEVKHWKDHAEEAGQGFSQVCKDYARTAARVTELRRRVEALAARYENTSRDARVAPDVIAHRLRQILEEARDA